MNERVRKVAVGLALGAVLVASDGCKRLRRTRSKPKSDAYADQLKTTVANKEIKVMHWPNYADYQPLVQKFYDDRNYEVAWVDNGKPTAQATAFIAAFQHADQKGLKPEDYDGSLWSGRVQGLSGDDAIAQFDAAMTVNVMRYISDLRIGRVNPTHFNFDINVQEKKYDLPEFVSDNAVDADDVPKLVASVEPDSEQYRESEAALVRYEGLAAKQGQGQPIAAETKPLTVGGTVPDAGALRARLQLEGDLAGDPVASAPVKDPGTPAKPTTGHASGSAKTGAAKAAATVKGGFSKAVSTVDSKLGRKANQGAAGSQSGSGAASSPDAGTGANAAQVAAVPSGPGAYTQELSDAVKHYQERHGITPDGKLTQQTVDSMNVPLSARAGQLADSLERWRWLPNEYLNAPLQVNLPEFVVRGFGDDHQQQFKMNVVVGQVIGEHQTPVFAHMMKYVIFRPYWNVPISIVKKELAGHIAKSGVGYLASKNFETVDSKGTLVQASAAEIERGGVMVREKPGPKNSLGLIKFMFPNEYDIYLHSTPAQQLFARTRRDFSHGCVRLEHPDQMAVWVMQHSGTPGDWDLAKVQDQMNNGPDNHQVNLKNEIPIVIFYTTARVAEDGSVDFFDDIYGYDKSLEDVLSKGRPYPSQQQTVDGNSKGGDTN